MEKKTILVFDRLALVDKKREEIITDFPHGGKVYYKGRIIGNISRGDTIGNLTCYGLGVYRTEWPVQRKHQLRLPAQLEFDHKTQSVKQIISYEMRDIDSIKARSISRMGMSIPQLEEQGRMVEKTALEGRISMIRRATSREEIEKIVGS